MVKNPLAMWETLVQSMGWEHLLEKRMASHSSILETFSFFFSNLSMLQILTMPDHFLI